MVKVAVEHPFTDVRRALEKRGFQADMIDQKTDAVSYDVVIVRDHEDFADFRMSGSLIEARGRTVNDIVEEVEERLQRAGKIEGEAPKTTSGSSFVAGLAAGAAAGAAAALLLTPKSGKEMQSIVKEKLPSGGGSQSESGQSSEGGGKMSQIKEKATGAISQVKEKLPSGGGGSGAGITDKVKGKVTELKEKKELAKAQKEIAAETKHEKEARKEHEKAEKQVEKEIKKADKEKQKEEKDNKGNIEVVELGDAAVDKNSTGEVVIQKGDNNDKK